MKVTKKNELKYKRLKQTDIFQNTMGLHIFITFKICKEL